MSNKKLSKNAKYERKRKDQGLKKVTVWIPDHAVDDFKDMCNSLCEEYTKEGGNRDLIPYMLRDLKTGRMKRY